ncbi:MAG: CCA tRNA nucleotidyltransferase [Nitrososphaerales archaeon]
MRDSREVSGNAIRLVTPTADMERSVGALAKSLLLRTRRAAAGFPETRGVLLGGSFAKGTWLPKQVDLDIFVRIDPKTPEDMFERIGLAVGAAATRGSPRGKKFAQHPYTEATVEGIRVNIVPCYSVRRGEWKSAADRSLFHVQIVRRLSTESKTQIRLLKRFMVAVGVYGAEIETRGFSGYAAEVLVMKFGSFVGVLRYFAGFKPSSRERLFSLPDPVDEGRDLAIAVSGEKLGRMILASREFLSSPREAYFRKMRGRNHPALRGMVFAVLFSHRLMSEDTLWGELRKTTKHIVRHLDANGFKIARSMAASDNRQSSAILLVPEYDALPRFEQRIGPTVDRKNDLESFISSNRKDAKLIWVDEEARARLLLPRRYLSLEGLLVDAVRGKVGPIGASSELGRGMKRNGSVLSGPSLARAALASKWLDDGIREIVSDAIGTRAS